MKRLIFILLYFSFSASAQNSVSFENAYDQYEYLPSGILEAVSYSNTHIKNISSTEQVSCSGMPLPYGIFGLFENGENYFKENGKLVEELSGIPITIQKSLISNQILAYAGAFNALMQIQTTDISQKNDPTKIYTVLEQLSEIPDSGLVNLFARDAQIFEYLRFMNSHEKAQIFQFEQHHFNLSSVFGIENYNVLSSKRISLSANGIASENNQTYTLSAAKSTQYGPAIWNPAPSCNFSSRSGTAVSAITIHTIQGTYAGAISWSQNCSSSVSYHYVVRSSDGQITQMVAEEEKAWHVGSENPYTIGYEHEGYVTESTWYTPEMYENSADLSRDIINSGYGIEGIRTYFGPSSSSSDVLGGCTKIKGHQHYPNQTHLDPGIYWDWEHYYRLINNNPSVVTLTDPTGNFYDSGGAASNYTDDERLIWLIEPANALNVTINFTAFSIENNYDYLYIYDGNSIDAPLFGVYTSTNSPGTISSTGGSLTIEFRSDCGTVSSGWAANWTSTIINTIPPSTSIENLSDWKTQNWTANFTDGAVGTVDQKYYLCASKPSGYNGWKSNTIKGFLNEDFDDNLSDWIQQTDSWSVTGNAISNTDINQSNTNSWINLAQNDQASYLYHWKQNITSSGANQRAGLHFFCDDPTLPNRGNSYFVYFRNSNNKVQIYKVVNDVFTMEIENDCSVNTNIAYDYKVTYDPQTGWIRVFANDTLVSEWQDPSPLVSGSAVSLRTGNCIVEFDDVRVYKSRSNTASVSVGPGEDFFEQSENSNPAGMIRSIVLDDGDLWSNVNSEEYLVDWTVPVIDEINDGSGLDLDTIYNPIIEGNWAASDPNSGLLEFEYAIGTTSGGTDVSNWTNNGLSQTFSHVLASPIYDQIYYLSLRATNGAGLINELVSDGQRLVEESSSIYENWLNAISIYPNPASDFLFFKNVKSPIEIFLYSPEGKLLLERKITSDSAIELNKYAAGIYQLVIRNGNQFVVKKVEIL